MGRGCHRRGIVIQDVAVHNVSMPADVSRDISFLMHDIALRTRVRFDARARRLGATRAQWRVLLALLHHDGCTQSQLAEILDVERITLCRMIDRLAEAGMVVRRADPADRRVWRLHLLPKAEPLVIELNTLAHEFELDLLRPLSPEQRGLLADLLLTVREGLGEKCEAVDDFTAEACDPPPLSPDEPRRRSRGGAMAERRLAD